MSIIMKRVTDDRGHDMGYFSEVLIGVLTVRLFAAWTVLRNIYAPMSLAVRKEIAWRKLQKSLAEIERGEFSDIDPFETRGDR